MGVASCRKFSGALCARTSTPFLHILATPLVAKYKDRYEDNTQYSSYTVAVKHETGELICDTDSLIGGDKSANNKLTSSLLRLKFT